MARKMINLLARHQGIYETAKIYHWLCKQQLQEFYGNHELFDKIADMFNPEADDDDEGGIDKLIEAFYMGSNVSQILEVRNLWKNAANLYSGRDFERADLNAMKQELLILVDALIEELNQYKHKDRGINSLLDAISENCLQSKGLLQSAVLPE